MQFNKSNVDFNGMTNHEFIMACKLHLQEFKGILKAFVIGYKSNEKKEIVKANFKNEIWPAYYKEDTKTKAQEIYTIHHAKAIKEKINSKINDDSKKITYKLYKKKPESQGGEEDQGQEQFPDKQTQIDDKGVKLYINKSNNNLFYLDEGLGMTTPKRINMKNDSDQVVPLILDYNLNEEDNNFISNSENTYGIAYIYSQLKSTTLAIRKIKEYVWNCTDDGPESPKELVEYYQILLKLTPPDELKNQINNLIEASEIHQTGVEYKFYVLDKNGVLIQDPTGYFHSQDSASVITHSVKLEELLFNQDLDGDGKIGFDKNHRNNQSIFKAGDKDYGKGVQLYEYSENFKIKDISGKKTINYKYLNMSTCEGKYNFEIRDAYDEKLFFIYNEEDETFFPIKYGYKEYMKYRFGTYATFENYNFVNFTIRKIDNKNSYIWNPIISQNGTENLIETDIDIKYLLKYKYLWESEGEGYWVGLINKSGYILENYYYYNNKGNQQFESHWEKETRACIEHYFNVDLNGDDKIGFNAISQYNLTQITAENDKHKLYIYSNFIEITNTTIYKNILFFYDEDIHDYAIPLYMKDTNPYFTDSNPYFDNNKYYQVKDTGLKIKKIDTSDSSKLISWNEDNNEITSNDSNDKVTYIVIEKRTDGFDFITKIDQNGVILEYIKKFNDETQTNKDKIKDIFNDYMFKEEKNIVLKDKIILDKPKNNNGGNKNNNGGKKNMNMNNIFRLYNTKKLIKMKMT